MNFCENQLRPVIHLAIREKNELEVKGTIIEEQGELEMMPMKGGLIKGANMKKMSPHVQLSTLLREEIRGLEILHPFSKVMPVRLIR